MRVNELRVGMKFSMPLMGEAVCMATPAVHPLHPTLVMVVWHYLNHPLGLKVSYDALSPFMEMGDGPVSMDPEDWKRAVQVVLEDLRDN